MPILRKHRIGKNLNQYCHTDLPEQQIDFGQNSINKVELP
jgi:hypothetical protein